MATSSRKRVTARVESPSGRRVAAEAAQQGAHGGTAQGAGDCSRVGAQEAFQVGAKGLGLVAEARVRGQGAGEHPGQHPGQHLGERAELSQQPTDGAGEDLAGGGRALLGDGQIAGGMER